MRGIITIAIAALTALAAQIVLTGCNEDAPPQETAPDKKISAAAETAAPAAFAPPPDSAINKRQFDAWQECGALLDMLTYIYADSLKSADAVQKLRLQEDFPKAKDKLCRRAGLAGGLDEYNWITQNIGSPRNKQFVEELW